MARNNTLIVIFVWLTTTSALAGTVKALNWTRDPSSCTLCGGYYKDSANILDNKTPAPIKNTPLNITASKAASFKNYGESVINGNVVLTQPGREIKADHVTFFRDKNTNQIANSFLSGNVKFHEYGRLVVADTSYLDFAQEEYTLNNGAYRVLSDTKPNSNNAWGTTKHGKREPSGVLKMRKATYSTCPPDATSWYLWSDNLILNRETGIGRSFNTIFFVKDIPILYTPYFCFPIDKRRATGFLMPNFVPSADPGYSLSLPLYLNLAPNYDALITPTFFNKRGVLLGGEFNYLTLKTLSKININYINQDQAFVNFRNDYASRKFNDTALPTHAQTTLKDSSANRGLFNLNNNIKFNSNWESSVIANYATDDYFLQDFGSSINSINQDQLFNQAYIKYQKENWVFSGKIEGFQTLHRIDRNTGTSKTQDLYKKLPQINLSKYFLSDSSGVDYYIDAEAVNFTKRDDFNIFTPTVGGGRFNLESGASMPLSWLGGSLTPRLSVQATQYALHDQSINKPNHITRALPLLSVDGKLFFSKNTVFLNKSYTQTLEPRLFYLWVPNKNQEDIPIFYTNLPGFDFNQLFRANRFSGTDRIGDANQMSAAITSRILNDAGQEKANLGIGQILNFHKHRVVLSSEDKTDPLLNAYLSPIVGKIQYFLTINLDVKAEAAWDPNCHRFNTTNINLQYKEADDKVLNLWYNYRIQGDTKGRNLSRIGCSAGWRLWKHWNILGGVNYNTTFKRSQNYIYGLEYESCCFAVRFLNDRTYIDSSNSYKSKIYVQILLKGLGDSKWFGLGSINNLSGIIPGYNNQHITGI